MLEPCAVKVASTVPRRGVGCEAGFLSDNYGEDAGNTYDKAIKLGIKTIIEEEMGEMI